MKYFSYMHSYLISLVFLIWYKIFIALNIKDFIALKLKYLHPEGEYFPM